jgi:hypothetical protein
MVKKPSKPGSKKPGKKKLPVKRKTSTFDKLLNEYRPLESQARECAGELNRVLGEAAGVAHRIPDLTQPEARQKARIVADEIRGNLDLIRSNALKLIGVGRFLNFMLGEVQNLERLESAAYDFSELLVMRNEFIHTMGHFVDYTVVIAEEEEHEKEVRKELLAVFSAEKSADASVEYLGSLQQHKDMLLAEYDLLLGQLDGIEERFEMLPFTAVVIAAYRDIIERHKTNVESVGATKH